MTSSPARFTSFFALIAFIALLPLSAEAAAKARPVGVTTRNLYLGADLTPAIAAPDLPGLVAAATEIWQQVQATNFPERAKALASEIKEGAPLLVGLQEVALWRTGPPDGLPTLGGTPATNVAYDFLALILGALANGNAPYQAVVVQQEADLEAPTALGFDIRLTMRDVILVRRVGEVHVDDTQSANFANNLTLPIAGGIATVISTRGWTAVDVVAKKRSFRFVNTHLEAFSNTFRSLQAQELLAGPLATSLPVVLVGDLNSASDDPVFNEGTPFDNTNPYDILIGAGFIDTWALVHPSVPGNTCCQDANLRNVQSKLVQRIDHVMITDGDAYRSNLLGDQPSERTRSGLWPSDHAGVTADVAP